MARYLLVLLALVAKPWVAYQSEQRGQDGASQRSGLPTYSIQDGTSTVTSPNPIPLELQTTSQATALHEAITDWFLHSSMFIPTDRPPTVPSKGERMLPEESIARQKLGAFYRTVYRGNATKILPQHSTANTFTSKNAIPTSSSVLNVTKMLNQSHIDRDSQRDTSVTTAAYYYDDIEKVPWRQGHTHHKSKHHQSGPHPPEREPTEKSGPYFRPPSAISHKYKNFRVEPGQPLDDIDPDCWPHCRNSTRGNKRKRKHSSNKKRKYYNYKLLYDTLKGDLRRQETEFYAWIFGATMLTLGSLTTLTSCFVFCFCSEKWRKRRQTKRYDKSGQYQRVDSVSSVVDSHLESQDHQDQLDSVTII